MKNLIIILMIVWLQSVMFSRDAIVFVVLTNFFYAFLVFFKSNYDLQVILYYSLYHNDVLE